MSNNTYPASAEELEVLNLRAQNQAIKPSTAKEREVHKNLLSSCLSSWKGDGAGPLSLSQTNTGIISKATLEKHTRTLSALIKHPYEQIIAVNTFCTAAGPLWKTAMNNSCTDKIPVHKQLWMITAPTKWPSEQTAMTMSNSCTNKRPPKANSCEHFLRCQTTVSLHPKHKIQLLAPSTKADSKDQQEQNFKKSHNYLKKIKIHKILRSMPMRTNG